LIDFKISGEETPPPMPTLVLLWVWGCAYLNCAGWALSAIHQLNAAGYAVALMLGLAAAWVWRWKTSPQFLPQIHWQKYRRRFRRPLPLAFVILAAMTFLGGVIYAPTNYDALAYRLPRVLHWLQADQWHWIHSFFDRVNNRSCGIEWVSAPFLALLKTDRPLFLINLVSFLLLPGLVFSVFTRLGVRRCVAWHWMWIAPTGYCFVLQAGSIGNDLFGAVFALAAVNFALRARASQSDGDIFASVLAAALMTSAKLSNLPLLLPWAVALLPALKSLCRWPVRTLAVCVIAAAASGLPTMYLNAHFSGDWSGAGLRHGDIKHAALIKTGANTVLLAVQNLTPPIFPFAAMWKRGVSNLIPARVTMKIGEVMVEPQAAKFSTEEMQMEENAGLGFGVSLLLLASMLAAVCARPKTPGARDSCWWICVRWSPVISLLAVISQSNLAGIGRILTPYYLLLLPPLIASAGQVSVVKKLWWRASAIVVCLLAASLLIVSPARPLFPAQTILEKIHMPGSRLLERMKEVYFVYANRNDSFAPVRAILPPGLKVLGVVTFDDPVTSLWNPSGSRRIEYVCPGDTAADLKARGIEYVLFREQAIGQWFHCSSDIWLQQMNARVITKLPLNLRASTGPADWYLIRLN
jgi:hypothetical protein